MSSSSSSPEILSAAAQPEPQDRFSYKHATHEEVLEDLSSRFILNLPDEELASLERICFQVEQAHWFYEDFIREENPKFPSLPLKKFSAMLFHACPLLHQWSHDHEQAFNTFMQYKTRVPVCGAIMLNDTWEKCVLVKGWKSSSGWGFPKGKINEDEPAHSCAIREVLEETGYNLASQINKDDVIEMSIKEQKISLYIVAGVSEDYPFKTKTRKEISKIEWFKLTDLPTWKRNKAAPGKFYLISPFIGALKAFINERKPRAQPRKGPKLKKPIQNGANHGHKDLPPHVPYHDATQESSSQSSSVDNGDPHTPSPLYSNAAPTHVVHDGFAQSVINSESLDPHFAKLLSSLSLSAAAAASGKRVEAPLSINTSDPVPEPSTPVPSSSGSQSLAIPANSDWSSSTPAALPDQPLPEESEDEVLPVITEIKSQPQSLLPRTSFQSPSPLILSPRTNGAGAEQRSSAGSDAPASATSSTHSVASLRALGSRRTSSTADVSPYLTRSSEVPGSAKRLKQLALLECVADESARMLSHRAPPPAMANPRPGMNGTFVPHYPLPPASVPPPPYDPMQVLYSSGQQRHHHHHHHHHQQQQQQQQLPTNGFNGIHPGQDPFQVRPWTSQAFHRVPMGGPMHGGGMQPMHSPGPSSMSMSQGQLLAIMNRGTPQGPAQAYPGPPPYFAAPFAGVSYPRAGPPPQLRGQFPVNVGAVPPMSAPAISPGFPANPALLSILNGGRT
ncbi:Dcp2, box A domain-containing protein [Mycena alexandri]|uniref:Dcp2, box A domain-containing protein n=1 Tax=Mycena alexandri TaxID=1745969 RepID=A0AAD6X412_9AGAR|nr:Dcp2, box A domain-containing protein [Mycena alexandri]